MVSANPPNPRVGVAAVVVNDQGKVLIGKRKGSLGSGSWQFPGGHLEHGEELLACATRETLEETGLAVRGAKVVTVTNDVFVDAGKHYITVFILCRMENPVAEPRVMEVEKCDMWIWWDWEKLFSSHESGKVDGVPLFLPMFNLLQQFGTADEVRQKFH